ncbi:Ger(x)C family spore germination protein [Thermolongibacillus altinsuensis]|uniref:Ger(x)C family spore germination protein n=1 Tax=Thermolongibacillus altinsuensis TaxID=575256 RepID=UPI00242A2D1A|nr:Ger(x)C family spore germination protein [Thermolongibacillus altinsuensis]GMB08645.1 spore germination protein [Thermolongibacillus altinsuensis]
MKWWIVIWMMLAGCVEPRILEEQGIFTAVGFDKVGERYKASSVMLSFRSQRSSRSEVIQATNVTSKGTRQDLEAQTSHNLGSGQLRVVLYGKELAEKEGIFLFTDTFRRDANIGSLVYLAVAESSAEEIVKSKKLEDVPDIGTYLYRLIEKNLKSESLLAATLHEFIASYYDVGKDPILPYLSLQDGKPIIKYVALFHRDRFVGKIRLDESFYIKLLSKKYNAGMKNIIIPRKNIAPILLNKDEFEKNIKFVLNEIRSDSKIKLVSAEPVPSFRIHVKMDAEILEISEKIKPFTKKNINMLEKAIEKQMKHEIDRLLKKLKKHNADPIGFGQIYDHSLRRYELTNQKWDERYKKAKIDVRVDINILRTGTID